jgi:hypothetical protein
MYQTYSRTGTSGQRGRPMGGKRLAAALVPPGVTLRLGGRVDIDDRPA